MKSASSIDVCGRRVTSSARETGSVPVKRGRGAHDEQESDHTAKNPDHFLQRAVAISDRHDCGQCAERKHHDDPRCAETTRLQSVREVRAITE